jgi:hypothetical protein
MLAANEYGCSLITEIPTIRDDIKALQSKNQQLESQTEHPMYH